MLSAEVATMHSISVQLNDSQFEQVDDMAKQSHKSRSEIMREAISAKVEYEAHKQAAIDQGIESAMNEPRISHAKAKEHFKATRDAA
ncbi:MAG: ribbon-helix-helix protein, CopG family [Gallionellaceae bacterium]